MLSNQFAQLGLTKTGQKQSVTSAEDVSVSSQQPNPGNASRSGDVEGAGEEMMNVAMILASMSEIHEKSKISKKRKILSVAQKKKKDNKKNAQKKEAAKKLRNNKVPPVASSSRNITHHYGTRQATAQARLSNTTSVKLH